jgi:hypothetical protein
VCLYVSGTGSDQVSLSQHKYFLFGELLKFSSFLDDAFSKNTAQKISMPKRQKELFVRHSASTQVIAMSPTIIYC